jgi:hypothetical protein
MLRVKKGEEFVVAPIRAQVRFDFSHEGRSRGVFFRRRPEECASEERERQVAILKNVPYQGIVLENIDAGREIYTLVSPNGNGETAYAPVEMTVLADSIEDLIAFTLREEMRRIKIIEPEEMVFSSYDVERALFRMTEEYREDMEQFD